MKAAQWIDRVKTQRGWLSDYRVAKELAITQSAASNYRRRESTLDEDTALKVANALQLDPVLVLADQAALQVVKDRAVWPGAITGRPARPAAVAR